MISDCECHPEGSNGLDCNQDGVCICNDNVEGTKCDVCSEGYTGHPTCDSCDGTFFGYPECQGHFFQIEISKVWIG